MDCIAYYESPLGRMTMAGSGDTLTGLWFDGQKHFGSTLTVKHTEGETAVFQQTREWLELYFSGREPGFTPPIMLQGTPFQREVWAMLRAVPYGRTVTYGELAKELAGQRNIVRMSAQAVGAAVGRNPVSIIIPCHRVIGADGSLTGYAGGIDRKNALLLLESDAPGYTGYRRHE